MTASTRCVLLGAPLERDGGARFVRIDDGDDADDDEEGEECDECEETLIGERGAGEGHGLDGSGSGRGRGEGGTANASAGVAGWRGDACTVPRMWSISAQASSIAD